VIKVPTAPLVGVKEKTLEEETTVVNPGPQLDIVKMSKVSSKKIAPP
jgi:hypothetical protein